MADETRNIIFVTDTFASALTNLSDGKIAIVADSMGDGARMVFQDNSIVYELASGRRFTKAGVETLIEIEAGAVTGNALFGDGSSITGIQAINVSSNPLITGLVAVDVDNALAEIDGSKADTDDAILTGTVTVAEFKASTFAIKFLDNALSEMLEIAPSGAEFSVDVILSELRATTSAGLLIESANGTDIGLLGAGNTANVTWYGAHTVLGQISSDEKLYVEKANATAYAETTAMVDPNGHMYLDLFNDSDTDANATWIKLRARNASGSTKIGHIGLVSEAGAGYSATKVVVGFRDGASSWRATHELYSDGGLVMLNAAAAIYMGKANVDGTWRIRRDGTNLVYERRESGSYV